MLLKTFEDAFGDLGELEVEWERYLNRLEGAARSKGVLRRGAL